MLWIFAVALVCRFAVFLVGVANADDQGSNPAFFWYDSGQYLEPARSLLLDGSYTVQSGDERAPYFIRPPAYPVFIALCQAIGGERTLAILVPQLFLSALTCSLAYWIGAMVYQHRVGLIAGWLMAFDQSLIAYSNKVMTETFAGFFFLLSTVCLVLSFARARLGALLLGGICLGVATLAHGGTVLYWVVPVTFLAIWGGLSWKQKLVGIALFLAGWFVTTVPWQVRNQLVFGIAELAPGGHTLMTTAADVLWAEQPGLDRQEARDAHTQRVRRIFEERYGLPVPNWADAELRRRYFRQFNNLQTDESKRVLREHAGTYAKLAADGLLKLTVLPLPYAELCRFAATQELDSTGPGLRSRMMAALKKLVRGEPGAFARAVREVSFCKLFGFTWNIAYWMLVVPASLFGVVWTLRQRHWIGFVLLLGTVAYFVVTLSLIKAGDGMQRYRLRMLPYLYCVAAVGWTALPRREAGTEQAHTVAPS